MTGHGFGRLGWRGIPRWMTAGHDQPSTGKEWEVVKLEESARWDRWPLLRAVP